MRLTILVASPCLLALSAAELGCDRRASDEARATETTGATQEPPTVEKVEDEPSRFYGKHVMLSGEVENPSPDARAFTLEGSKWLWGDEIRVLAKSPIKLGGAPLSEDQDVVVSGAVRRFVVAEVERELGWDLSPELEIELRDKPVLVADLIRRVEPAATWSAKKPEGGVVGTVLLLTTAEPSALVGQSIDLASTKVQSASGKGIWIGSSHVDQTFVLPKKGASVAGIYAGDVVDVHGTIAKTPPADQAIKAWGVPATLKSVIEGEPVYVEATVIERVGRAGGNEKRKP